MRNDADENGVFLSTLAAGPRERRLALAVVLVSLVVFLFLTPYAQVQLAPMQAFIPIYQSALLINDLITAILLCGQFNILRSRALLVLACAYLFTAFMIVAHTLSFPGLFAPTGLLGAGPQSTAWLYMFWHGGFPLFVIAYALLKNGKHKEAEVIPSHRSARAMLLISGAGVLIAAVGFTLLATAGQNLLPPIMQGNRYTPAMIAVVSSVWAVSLGALVVLWRRKPHSVLDLWLMVVLCAWMFDIALSAVLNAGRFDLGFYSGRIYGLLAASFVLVVLLLENGLLYARLVETHRQERRKTAELQRLSAQVEIVNRILAEKNRELERASQFKSEFLANMSHELRTPLNAIIGYSEGLKDGFFGPLSAAHQDYVTQIFESGQHLLSLINDILDLSKIEAGKMSLDLEEVAPNEMLEACLSIVGDKAARRGVMLKFDTRFDSNRILTDPRKLRQIVYNLLSNAVKFTREGGTVQLSVRPVKYGDIGFSAEASMASRVFPLPAGEFEDFIEIRVSDNGIGIKEEDFPKLFQTFQQIDSSLARQHDGTGLGLALVSRLAELHGGTAGVASAPGRGSHFSVWLPWRKPSSA